MLIEALRGRVTDYHRFMLQLYLQQHDALAAAVAKIDQAVDAAITRMDEEVEAGRATFLSLIILLCSVPGVSILSATTILAEIGTDMSRFPTAGHLLAWAGLCPSQNESAGKRKSSRLRKGAPWLKTMLVQCAWAASRKKDSYYKAQFNRLRSKRGPKKAICAVAASMLTAIYHMLKDGTLHQDLGADHFDRRSTEIKAKRLVAQLLSSASRSSFSPSRRRHDVFAYLRRSSLAQPPDSYAARRRHGSRRPPRPGWFLVRRPRFPGAVTTTARLCFILWVQPSSKQRLVSAAPTAPPMCGRRSVQSRQGRQNRRRSVAAAKRSIPNSARNRLPSSVTCPPSSPSTMYSRLVRKSARSTLSRPARWS